MESGNRKIYSLAGVLLFSLLMFAEFDLLAQSNNAQIWDAKKLKIPIYQEGRDHPILILYSKAAKPIGLRYEMKGVKLDWLGETISEIKGTVETPTAVYDQSTKTVAGNKKITYRSKEIDIDGVGFDIDQERQTIHIRSEVEVTLKGDLTSTRQRREAKGKKKNTGALSLIPTNTKGKSSGAPKSKLKQLLNEITVKKETDK
jgi:hypothetical protein